MARRIDQQYTIPCQFHPHRFILSPLSGRNLQILLHFQLQSSLVAPRPPSGAKTKLNGDAQYKLFPYPMSKPFLCANPLVMFSCSQTLRFIRDSDKQKKQKTSSFFACPGGARSLSPFVLGVVIQKVRTILALLNVFIYYVVSPIGGGVESLVENAPRS